MEHKLATAERRVLVGLVKLVQKKNLKGENGDWKEFLNVHDKRNGANLSDPDRRSNDVLIAFLSTFKKKEDLQLIAKVLRCDVNRKLIEKFKEESPDKEKPEQRLVRMTIVHEKYATHYAFPSYAEDWFVTGIGKKLSKAVKSTRMLAIDCEMVLCEDGNDALVRVAAVNRECEVVLHEYVKPELPVIDYRTHITGVTAQDLEKATLSVSGIQNKLRRFLEPGTILVGHGLHNDLKVLKIDHARVIDTSLVFNYAGFTNPPSLENLCKSVLGFELRQKDAAHDCVHDAIAAMRLVLAVVEKGVDTSIPVTNEMLEGEKDKKKKLFLHRIPHYVPSQELESVITGDFTLDIKPVEKEGGFYRAVAEFNSCQDANLAFDNVDGDLVKDRAGLPQKLVVFKLSSGTGASLFVRKMVPDSTTTKRSRQEEKEEELEEKNNNKRQKREDDDNDDSELKKIEELKSKLLLHKIPHYFPSQELKSIITGDFAVDVQPAKKNGGFYSAVVVFNSWEEANRVFDNIDGRLAKDRAGLPQKLAVFKMSSGTEVSLFVRKMVSERGHGEEEEGNVNRCEDHLKEIEELKEKLKAKENNVMSCESHAKEIEELKQRLKAKDFEIQAQDKMITNLKDKLDMKKKKKKSKSK